MALSRVRSWLFLVGLSIGAQVECVHADQSGPGLSNSRLAETDAQRTSDHERFVSMLADLHREAAFLTSSEKSYLLFLDGWEANYEGRLPEAEAALREVMDHAESEAVATRATAMLMNNLTDQGKYAEAYAIATRAADTLPDVTDPVARFSLLANLSQMLTFAGQPDLGLKYADMMVSATPVGQSLCQAMVQKVTALEGARQLTSHSQELLQTIDICTSDRQPIFANTVSLILVDRLFAEHKLAEALAVIQRITPAIMASRYFAHITDLASARAQIFGEMGSGAEARKPRRRSLQ